jgi:hypothetical protein
MCQCLRNEKKSDLNTKSASEHTHQMMGNLIRSSQLQDKPYYDLDDPWGGIFMALACALRSTNHMTLQVMPGQLVFGRDMILNVQHLTD